MTQNSSQARVKFDALGDDAFKVLFASFKDWEAGVIDINGYREVCVGIINKSAGSKETKAKFVKILTDTTSADKMVKTVTNYMLAGEGKGV